MTPVCLVSLTAKEKKKVTVGSMPSLPSDRSLCQAGISRHIVVMMLSSEGRMGGLPQCLFYAGCEYGRLATGG